MNLIKWQPVDEIKELSHLLERSFQRHSYPSPKADLKLSLDIHETEDAIVLRASLPGAKKEDISVEIEDQILTVKANIAEPDLPEGAVSLLQESTYGEVSRTLKIKQTLNLKKSKGRFVDGILEVTFPKAAEAKKKSIKIE